MLQMCRYGQAAAERSWVASHGGTGSGHGLVMERRNPRSPPPRPPRRVLAALVDASLRGSTRRGALAGPA